MKTAPGGVRKTAVAGGPPAYNAPMSDPAASAPQSLADVAPDALRDQAEAAGDAWRIELSAYAGPMDLLLYLVKRHEIDLNNIPMARLTAQYMLHVKAIQSLDVDRAAEFLVMAATLLEIKSRMILPSEAQNKAAPGAAGDGGGADHDDGHETADPRLLLVQQLLAYKKFKDAAWELERRQGEFENRFVAQARKGRAPIDPTLLPKQAELDLDDLNVLDLQKAFEALAESIGFQGDHQVSYDDTPIALHADDIADLLARDGAESPEKLARGMTLRELFTGRKSKSEMIGLFLATLELVRNFIVRVAVDEGQPGNPDCVRLVLRPEADRVKDKEDNDTQRDWRDPFTGEVQYAWPDEETGKRARRRLHLRAIVKARTEAEASGRKFDLKAWKKQQEALAKARGLALAEMEDVSEDDLLEEEVFAADKLPEHPGEPPMPEVPEVK